MQPPRPAPGLTCLLPSPIAGKEWLTKYFPVDTPSDECAGDICLCPATGDRPEWAIQQGRVYAQRSGGGTGPSEGNGFGLHLVNVSEHSTVGGMTTAQVEAQFTAKLSDMHR